MKPPNCLNRRDHLSTELLFELALWFRLYTSGRPLRISQGEPMPQGGEPRFPIVCQFLEDALGVEIDEDNARNRLHRLIKDNSHIGLVDWPA